MIFSRIKVFVWLLCISLALICLAGQTEGGAKKAAAPAPAAPIVHEPVIEEVTQKQLERLLQDKDYVAVYWCKWPLTGVGTIHYGGWLSLPIPPFTPTDQPNPLYSPWPNVWVKSIFISFDRTREISDTFFLMYVPCVCV